MKNKSIEYSHNDLRIDGKRYSIERDTKENKKFIIYKGQKYSVLDNYEETLTHINDENKVISFSKCILLFPLHLGGADIEIKASINFSEVLIMNLHFTSCTFKNIVHFQDVIFFYDMSVTDVNFERPTTFYNVTFNKKVSFYNTEFKKNLDFHNLELREDILFSRSKFERIFSLRNTNFSQKFEILTSRINELSVDNVEFKGKSKLNLSGSNIERIHFINTSFNKVTNKETFLILKEVCLKRHDQTRALEFYKNEMLMHKKIIKKEGMTRDWLILEFEYFVSEFGTNPTKPIFIMIYISFLFGLFFSAFSNTWGLYIYESILLLNPTQSIANISDVLSIDKNKILYLSLLESINFIKNILFGVLIYESVKSFRKFSRKL